MQSGHLINEIIELFVQYGHSKSGGHGGQKINKKQSKAELFFDVQACTLLSEEQKDSLSRIYHNRISKEGVLHLSSSQERSYHRNRKDVTKHFHQLVENILDGNPHHLRGRHPKKKKH